MGCLNEKILSSYLDKRLSETERQKIEVHISECNNCLDLLLVAYEVGDRSQKYPALLKQKIKERLGVKQKKMSRELKWLIGAFILFVLSFVFKRFFLQFLMAAVVLGFKWAMEGEGARRAIMIFRGMQKDETSDSPQNYTHRSSLPKPRN